MANVEKYDDLIIGSGIAGKFTAWTRDSRRRMAIVERGLLGGACPNVACLQSKNLIWSAKVISLARRGMEFGLKTDSLSVDMAAVQCRKRMMVRELREAHEEHTEASGAELTYGIARFVAPRTVEIELRDGGTRTIQGDRVFLDLGSRAAIPQVPGLAEATPMTHVEALELDRLPRHLIVLGGGYVGLELSQAFRRYRLIPFCMFTDSELARVGKNEVEARLDGIEYRIAKLQMAEVLRTKTISEPRGFMKVLVGKDSDEILGFTAFAFEATS
jgi:pyruvate/2-oxoglutarate dehydrogenase complex dihydrolipoamide dehydrogenase (E3) component